MSAAKGMNAFVKSMLPDLRSGLGLAEDASHTKVNQAIFEKLGSKPSSPSQLEPILRPSPREEAGWNLAQNTRQGVLSELTSRQNTGVALGGIPSGPERDALGITNEMRKYGGEVGGVGKGPMLIGSNATADPVSWRPTNFTVSGDGQTRVFADGSTSPVVPSGNLLPAVRDRHLPAVISQTNAGGGKKADGYSWLFNEGSGPNWTKPFKGMANGVFNNLTSSHLIRPITGAVTGAVGGAVAGLVGQEALPNNMQYDGFVQPMFKGALIGAALGMAGPAASGLTKVLNRPEMENYAMLKGPASLVTKASHSGLYKGATTIAAGGAGFFGAFSTNFTNPVNKIDRA